MNESKLTRRRKHGETIERGRQPTPGAEPGTKSVSATFWDNSGLLLCYPWSKLLYERHHDADDSLWRDAAVLWDGPTATEFCRCMN